MATFSLNGIALRAIAAAVPTHRESNLDFDLLSEADRTFLIKTTGVKEKRKSPAGMTCSDLCFQAAEAIFANGQVKRDEIGLLILVSQSNDYYLPATAAILQHRLGLPESTMAFDVGLGCSGYIYGLTIAASLMKTCGISKALLLAGDNSSTTCSPEDKSTYPLFGDAGTATLLESTAAASPWLGNLFTDGSGAEAIMVPHGMGRHPPTEQSFKRQNIAPGIRRAPLHLSLKGEEIFAFSIKQVPSSIKKLLAEFDEDIDSLDYLVMHQANKLMNETIRKKLKLPEDKVPYSLDEFGNTSSASIPLTIVTRLAGQLQNPARLMLSGFGVGLSWGNLLLQTQAIQCLPLIEVDA